MAEKIITYDHHGTTVHVKQHLKGSHRDNCLCFSGCAKFKPDHKDHCPAAAELYQFCVKHGMTTPVYECPYFEAADETA